MIEMRPKHDHVTEIIDMIDATLKQNAEFWVEFNKRLTADADKRILES